ncbi:MAG: omptin family outer membrane protease [Nitrospirota bacterium]
MIRPVSAAIAITASLFLALSQPVIAAPAFNRQAGEGLFGFGLGYLTGSTLYHISIYDATGGVESELEFPLNTFLFGLEGGYVGKNANGRDAFKIGLQWSTNLDSGSGKLKDSDWISGTAETDPLPNGLGLPAHPGLDIYSESDIALTANILDLRASYNFWPSKGLVIGPLGGLLYQNFQFDASNVHQVGYGPYAPGFTGSVSGLVLTYEVTYTIPYLGMHSELLVGRGFQAFLDLGYSPWAAAKDRDDHVLRKKLSTAKTDGYAYLATITAQWDIEDNDFFLIRGQYLEINTKGTQTQTFYDGSGDVFAGINDKITSKQLSTTVLFSHRF